jgi:PAS domain S-box-containing protein
LRKCPFCAEKIQDKAIVCRFCGRSLLKPERAEIEMTYQAVASLEESERRFRLLVENAQDLIYRYRIFPTPAFEYVSPSATRLTGYTPNEFYIDSLLGFEMIYPDDRHLLAEIIQTGIVPEKPLVLRWTRKDGDILWVEQQIALLHDPEGTLVAVESTARNITEREQRRHELEAIVAIGASMRYADTREELLAIILNQCIEMLNLEGAALAAADPYSDMAIIEQGCGRFAAAAGQHFPLEVNLFSLSNIKEPVQAGSGGLAGALFSYLGVEDETHLITCVPLIIQQELIGVLVVEHARPFHSAQKRLLTTVIEIAGNALQRTTFAERTGQYNRQMALAGELGLMLAKTLDLSSIYAYAGHFMRAMLPDIAGLFVALFNEETNILTCVYAFADGAVFDPTKLPPVPLGPPGSGTQSQAVRSRRPVIIADITEGRKQSRVDVLIGKQPDKVSRSGLYVPMLAKEKVIGVVNVQSYQVNRFSKQDAEVITLVGNTTAMAIENSRLVQGLKETNQDLLAAYDATITGWTLALDLRDQETEGHSVRVTDLTAQLARAWGIGEEEIIHIRRGALLHDIGKIGIPDAILNKPGSLTDAEWVIMRTHPQSAFDMISQIQYLHPALDIPYCHHEKWDGSGYPRGLKGEEIPLPARLFALVDVWDALRSDRPYRLKWPVEKVIDYIQSQSGTHFDPKATELFLEIIKESM